MTSHSGTDDIQNVIQKTNKLIMRSQNQYVKKDFKRIIKKLDILIKKLDWLEWKELENAFDNFRPHGQAVPLVWSIKSKSCLTKGFWPALWNIRPCARWPERQFWCRYGKRITQIVTFRTSMSILQSIQTQLLAQTNNIQVQNRHNLFLTLWFYSLHSQRVFKQMSLDQAEMF